MLAFISTTADKQHRRPSLWTTWPAPPAPVTAAIEKKTTGRSDAPRWRGDELLPRIAEWLSVTLTEIDERHLSCLAAQSQRTIDTSANYNNYCNANY